MKFAVHFAAALLVLSATGCIFGKKHKESPPPPVVDLTTGASVAPATTNTFIVTPDLTISGRVVRVNQNLRFVVLTFPSGQTPANGTRMNVYRRGEIVGEVRVTDQQRNNNAIADIVLGDAQNGDDVRQK